MRLSADTYPQFAADPARMVPAGGFGGFAINGCVLVSPGGMVDLARPGCLCSTIREAVTAVENRENAGTERKKDQARWRIAVAFGFVFPFADFRRALPAWPPLSADPL